MQEEAWQIELMPNARDELAKLDRQVAARIVAKLMWLARRFDAIVPEPMHGEWAGCYKFRVGNWRVIYTVERDQHIIVVHLIGHRNRIYKRRR